jgi:hypothetical protein
MKMGKAGTIGVCAASFLLSAAGGAGFVWYDTTKDSRAAEKQGLEAELAKHKAVHDAGRASSSDAGITVVSSDAQALAQPAAPAKEDGEKITIAMLGGIDLKGVRHDNNLFAGIAPHLKRADLVIGSLGYFPNLSSGAFKQLHLDVAVLANMIAGNLGKGVKHSLEALADQGIKTAGINTNQVYAENMVKGANVCTFAFSSKSSSKRVNRFSLSGDEVKKGLDVPDCDLKIVYLDWGTDDQRAADENMEKAAEGIIKAGADLIVGHGSKHFMNYYYTGVCMGKTVKEVYIGHRGRKIDKSKGEYNAVLDVCKGKTRWAPVMYNLGRIVSPNAGDFEVDSGAILLAEYDVKNAGLKLSYLPTRVEKKGDVFSVIDLNKKVKACSGTRGGECYQTRKSFCNVMWATADLLNNQDIYGDCESVREQMEKK